MHLFDNSKILYFSDKKLNEEEHHHLYIPDRYQYLTSQITKYQGEYYYYKLVNIHEMANELIGSALAKRIDLDTVDYKIGKTRINSPYLYALSKVFFEKDFTYTDCYDVYGEISEYQSTDSTSFLSYFYLNDTKLLEREENYNTILDVLKLTALDLKMGQFDRHEENLFLKIDSVGQIALAPIFDYGCSYSDKFYSKIYNNPFLMLRKNKLSLFLFARKFSEIREYASLLESIPIHDVLSEIENEHMIEFSDKKRSYYQKRDKQNNKILQKIIR